MSTLSFTMLVGIPYSGKSTFVREALKNHERQVVILSTDDYIQNKSDEEGISYNQGFQKFYKDAEKYMYDRLQYAIDNDLDIIWDQTNLTVKGRASKLKLIPDKYAKLAIFIPKVSNEEALKLKKDRERPEKPISEAIMLKMNESYVEPTQDEGFNTVMELSE